ncbi:MAG: DUF5606 domain-containing protein [Tenuifilaceae bacterium]|jgi:hypothetical protein|nr:DUF5606 domain-containing protein [Tenuifilaceae bacterium]
MALKDIMAISGYSGLYKFVSQGRNGIIVESLTDGKRSHISASAKVSALSDIAIFTNDGEKPLREILNSIKEKENGGPTISAKSSNDELKKFFLTVEPNFDTERVYVSDIKKLVGWYNLLQEKGMLDFSEDVEEKQADDKASDSSEAIAEDGAAPKKKAQPKSATAKEKKPAAPKKTPNPKAKPAGDVAAKKSGHQKKS